MRFLAPFLFACAILLMPHAVIADPQPLRLGMTSATAHNQYALLEEWRAYLESKLDRPVELVFRESYEESLYLLRQNKLDFAWISTPAYVENQSLIDLLASPLYHGHPLDQAYLIVPVLDHDTHTLQDLKDGIFAYVDPVSNTGYTVTRHQLQNAGQDPDQFFKRTFFTHDHLKVIAAVAIGLSDAGSVSGYAWDTLALSRPDITGQTRIVSKTGSFAFPPIVARNSLSKSDSAQMRQALLQMSTNSEGRRLLGLLNLDGFVAANPKLYQNHYSAIR